MRTLSISSTASRFSSVDILVLFRNSDCAISLANARRVGYVCDLSRGMKLGSATAVNMDVYALMGDISRLRTLLWDACECKSALLTCCCVFSLA